MRLVFVSNALDHIQMPLCDAWYALTEGSFAYVAVASASAIRSNITAADINKSRPYVKRPYESPEQEQEAQRIVDEADVVILGTAPERYIYPRLKAGKLTFRYMERLYKTPFTLKNAPRRVISALLHHSRFQRKPLHLLCAGAYAAADHARFGNYRGKRYVWGYFPAFQPVDIRTVLEEKKTQAVAELIWVGRFVSLKHPEHVIELGRYLKNKGYAFRINMVGYGEETENCKKLVEDYGLQEQVQILGGRPPEQVRQLMSGAQILLFTSDRQEGWGAVVNEGMNSGCAVVASAQAGVSPYLVNDGENGLLYDCNCKESLFRKVELLLKDQTLREKLAVAGYETVKELWNPENAAGSFLKLVESVESGRENPVAQGPCSNAPVLKDGWYRES